MQTYLFQRTLVTMGKLVMYTGQQPSTKFLPKINTFVTTPWHIVAKVHL